MNKEYNHINGLLLVNKPSGWTSHDVVSFCRSHFQCSKVGHCGTLDPAATGLLLLVFGNYTKLSNLFSGEDKTYEATIKLGMETDSMDMDGEIIHQAPYEHISISDIREKLLSFVGETRQVPPMVSALKVNGKKLYQLARKGMEIEREPRSVFIHSITFGEIKPPYIDFSVSCSKGTYIRSLASDFGKKLGCGATLYKLNRIRIGNFFLEDAHDIETIREWNLNGLQNAISNYFQNKLSKMAQLSDW
ncbi:MAG: tRNA pseudouridine(55) synthase TruB [Bacteroidales bacterium]|nr:tRNA pseudouridine(55) synthase TruB [Bacteroidales bacterium]